jgi:hypothetical protein
MYRIVLACFIVLCSVSSVNAAPVYALGTECPSDTQMVNTDYTRQYYVTPSLACVYDNDPTVNNIQGTTAEAEYYLDVFGTGTWVGLGETEAGFSYTADAGNDDGTFTISPELANMFDNIAIAIKDGAFPYFGIFLLPTDTLSGTWGMSTTQGDLSHFALFGFIGDDGPIINPTCPNCPPGDDPPAPIPEPASLLLLGSGLATIAAKYRKRKSVQSVN